MKTILLLCWSTRFDSLIVEINSVVSKPVFIHIIWSIKEASTLSKPAWIYDMMLNNLAIYQIFFLKCCTT